MRWKQSAEQQRASDEDHCRIPRAPKYWFCFGGVYRLGQLLRLHKPRHVELQGKIDPFWHHCFSEYCSNCSNCSILVLVTASWSKRLLWDHVSLHRIAKYTLKTGDFWWWQSRDATSSKTDLNEYKWSIWAHLNTFEHLYWTSICICYIWFTSLVFYVAPGQERHITVEDLKAFLSDYPTAHVPQRAEPSWEQFCGAAMCCAWALWISPWVTWVLCVLKFWVGRQTMSDSPGEASIPGTQWKLARWS
jgi:hypothetical protein